MARTLGAKNKPKTNGMRVINLNKQIPNSPIINSESPYNFVLWGQKNNFPDLLLELYHNSITHKSCVDFLATAICGEGIDYNLMDFDETETYPNFNDSWETFIYKLALDYILYGSFSFQIIQNRDRKTYSYYHQPFSTVRYGKKDENGNIKTAYICKNWSNYVKYPPIEIELFNFTDDISIKQGKPYLFVYSEYNPFDEYYSTPNYISAIDAIKTDISMKSYDYNSVLNNFTPSGILTMNQVSDDDEREMIIKNIEATFSGQENANNIIITFRNNSEDQPVQYVPIQTNADGVNLFADTNERTTNRIISAHKIPNKALLGIPMDSTGFSNEGSLLQASYNLLEKVTISHMRKKIINYINKMFAMNGIDTKIALKPLSFNINNIDEKTNIEVKPKINEINDENIEDTYVLN